MVAPYYLNLPQPERNRWSSLNFPQIESVQMIIPAAVWDAEVLFCVARIELVVCVQSLSRCFATNQYTRLRAEFHGTTHSLDGVASRVSLFQRTTHSPGGIASQSLTHGELRRHCLCMQAVVNPRPTFNTYVWCVLNNHSIKRTAGQH